MNKHYYAKYDTMVSKQNAGYGFCNSKEVLAFESKKERDTFLNERSHYDMSACIVSRVQAKKYKVSLPNGGKGIYIYGSEYMDYIVM